MDSGETKKKTLKILNLGRKVENQQLEEHLLTFMKNLDKAHLQFVSNLLILEALDEYPNWLGGVTALRFIDRAHQGTQQACVAYANNNRPKAASRGRREMALMR